MASQAPQSWVQYDLRILRAFFGKAGICKGVRPYNLSLIYILYRENELARKVLCFNVYT